MTRKDYELIASALLDKCPLTHSKSLNEEIEYHKDICRTIGNKLAEDNPRFDFNRFLIACGARTR